MKKEFEEALVEVIVFTPTDVIVTSSGSTGVSGDEEEGD